MWELRDAPCARKIVTIAVAAEDQLNDNEWGLYYAGAVSDFPDHKRVWRWLWVVLLLTALHVAYYFPRVVDDLFISLRYAENFARGEGIVFNLGERVEGYSSPSWMFLQALGFALGFEGITWTKLLGLLSLGAILLGAAHYLTRVLYVRALPAALSCLFIALHSYLIDWALLGLETPLYVALLFWYPITLHHYMQAPNRAHAMWAGACAVALAITRPEAPLYIAAVSLATLVIAPRTRSAAVASTFQARLKLGLRLGVPVLVILGILLLARRSYFGLWLPHTYYVKGATAGFDIAKLGQLVAQGAGLFESAVYLGGLVLAVVLAVTQRELSVLMVMGCALFFTASVEQDWMPSLRHLLPFTLFSALAWGWAIDRVQSWLAARLPARVLAGLMGALLLAGGVQVALVDVRYSPDDHHSNRPWAEPKSMAKWRDTMLAMRCIEPPHVAAMGSYDMGMITQNYAVLEASAQPVEKSWFIGRDIGKVGFYTEVRVFDTPGLFTPDVVQSEAWLRDHSVDAALIQRAFARKPVAAQLFGPWSTSAAAQPALLRDYEIVVGHRLMPIDITQNSGPVPSPAEVLRRYERSLAKFPQWFYFEELYGESVGAAMRKRVRIVREAVQAQGQAAQLPPPEQQGEGRGAVVADAAESLGCQLKPALVRPGDELTVTCWWKSLRPFSERFLIFQHFHDPSGRLRFNGDHPPASGLRHTTSWRPGEIIADVSKLRVPSDAPAGEYKLFHGMWKGNMRPRVTPAALQDGENRIAAGTLRVQP